MNALVVYDSQYGNTERVARAIASQLGSLGAVRLVAVAADAGSDLAGVDLLVVGGPTQGHGARPPLRAWVESLPGAALRGVAAAAFDTRLRWPVFLSGSTARTVAKQLQRGGARLVVPPESFLVAGREGPLVAGEVERASSWAKTLAASAASLG